MEAESSGLSCDKEGGGERGSGIMVMSSSLNGKGSHLGSSIVWPHEVEPWFHSWYRGRVETLDAKYNLISR